MMPSKRESELIADSMHKPWCSRLIRLGKLVFARLSRSVKSTVAYAIIASVTLHMYSVLQNSVLPQCEIAGGSHVRHRVSTLIAAIMSASGSVNLRQVSAVMRNMANCSDLRCLRQSVPDGARDGTVAGWDSS